MGNLFFTYYISMAQSFHHLIENSNLHLTLVTPKNLFHFVVFTVVKK